MGKRILILVQNEPVPSDRHVWNESSALVRAGYDVTVICPVGEQRDRETFDEIDGVTIHRYEPRRADGRPTEYAIEYLAALWSIRRLARRLSSERPVRSRPCLQPTGLPVPRGARTPPAWRPVHLRPSRPDARAIRDPLRERAAAPRDADGRAGRVSLRGRRAVRQRLLSSGRTRARSPRSGRRGGRQNGPRPEALPANRARSGAEARQAVSAELRRCHGAAGWRRSRAARTRRAQGASEPTGTRSSWETATCSTRCAR